MKREFFVPDMADPALQAKFWARVDRRTEHECWEWTGPRSNRGYGRVCLQGRSVQAHRCAYVIAGPLTDSSLVIDHICRNTSCVNPAHLRAITSVENVLIGIGPTAINARKRQCKNGHDLIGPNGMSREKGWRACRQCLRDREKIRRARIRVSGGRVNRHERVTVNCEQCDWISLRRKPDIHEQPPACPKCGGTVRYAANSANARGYRP